MQAFQRVQVSPAEPMADANIRRRYAIEQAAWIWHPALRVDEVATLRFTRTFRLDTQATTRLHVSADQRYELFIDGQYVSAGPHRSDLSHWSFASFEVVLEPGEHTLEALVWWIGDWMPAAQISHHGGFICAAQGLEPQVNTGQTDWQVQRLDGWSFEKPQMQSYHVIGPAQVVDGRRWFGSQEPPRSAAVVVEPVSIHDPTGIARGAWQLEPSPLPEMLRRPVSPGRARAVMQVCPRSEVLTGEAAGDPRIEQWQALLERGEAVEIPPNQTLHVLWDLDDYYCGYPSCTLSGGDGAELRYEWAESLYEVEGDGKRSQHKGQRDQIVGKLWLGFGDRFLPEGGEARAYRGHWWRSGRYVLLSIRTADQPLRVDRVELIETRYPYEDKSVWTSDDQTLDRYLPIARRGLWMCSHETYMDCPYYEQMMYVGDTRLEMLIAYMLSDDDRLTRRGIELFDWSRARTGFVAERYPSTPFQLSLTFSMLWVAMVYDYAHWRDDLAWVRRRLTGVRCLLEQFFALPDEGELLAALPGWSFVDWVPQWNDGIPADGRDGISSIINLLYVQCLQQAGELEDAFGEPALAQRYRRAAERVGHRIVERFWHEPTGRLADDLNHQHFSEHAQALALLTGVLSPERQQQALRSLMQDEDLQRATVYFSFYVLETLYRFGQGEALHKRFGFWKQLCDQGFRTPVESPEPSRSDCHAWGSHPLFHYHASVAGVRPGSPGFRKVSIAPAPGRLGQLTSTIPHPRGIIETRLQFRSEDQRCEGEIILPIETTGTFTWAGEHRMLQPGCNRIAMGMKTGQPRPDRH